MTAPITLIVNGAPVAKARPRVGRGGHIYTPGVTRAYETLVRQLGHTDERMPLNRRYSAIMSQPLDLASGDDEAANCRSELMLAVHKLTQILQQEFL